MHDLKALTHRLQKNFKKQRTWAEAWGTNAFRIYDADIPELKYYVDIYRDHAVVYSVFPGEIPHADTDLLQAVAEATGLNTEHIHLKARQRIKDRRGQYGKLPPVTGTPTILTVNEQSSHYRVNLSDYLDTGLFLDHRPLRAMLRKLGSANLEVQCKVLNLFCYTGSISVAAAQSGAHVTSVDLSSTYLKWAEQNFSLNNLPLASHPFVCASAWDYLENHENSSAKFDVIVVDPPTFSNSKKTQTSFDVQRDHRRLLEAAMELLADHGVLWFSTNFSKFELDKVLAKKFHCQEWTAKTVPADFSRGKAHRSFRFNR